jgi:uncharacterized membrane protein YphA (DoxX/SURF4 family)
MADLVLIVRVALALVFTAAAAGKLTTRGSSRLLVESFDLDRRLTSAAGALPWTELGLAAALLVPATARWAAAVSWALLAVFSSLLLRNRRNGNARGCNCFGAFGRTTLGRWPLVRNGLLLLLASLVAAGGVQLPVSAIWRGYGRGPLTILSVACGVTVLCIGVAWRRHALAKSPGPRDVLASPVTTLGSATTNLGSLADDAGRITLVFVDPGCGPCRFVLPALRDHLNETGPEAVNWPLLVVMRDGERSRELVAGMAETRVLIDDGSLAAACRVSATPSAVSIRGGRAEAVAVGLGPVISLLQLAAGGDRPEFAPFTVLGAEAVGPLPAAPAWTRREALTAAMTSVGAAVVAPALGPFARLTGKIASKPVGVQCPSCGPCTVCEVPGPSTTNFDCQPCAKKCSAHMLCTGYANQLAAYKSLAAYLADQGYVQVGEPAAGGLNRNGSLAYMSLVTTFASRSAKGQTAVLIYGLTNSGESASLAFLDPNGKISSVVTTGPNGGLISADVPVAPLAPISSATSSTASADIDLDVASCGDTCKMVWDVILLATTPLLTGELLTPAGWGLALGSFLIDQLVLGPLQSQIANLGIAGRLVNTAIDKFAGKTSLDKLEDQVGQMLCNDFVCKLKLTACCNYTGACYDSDQLCESKCPGGLAHPLAHCDVYLDGIKISTLIP